MSDKNLLNQIPLLRQAMSMPVFKTREEEFAVCTRAAAGDRRAIDEVVKRNMRLVAQIALKSVGGMSRDAFADLMQEGLLGVVRALQDFNPDRGFRFSTYATWWIRAYVTRSAKGMRKMVRGGDPKNGDLSLDDPISDEGDDTHLDMLRSDDAVDENAGRSALAESIHAKLQLVDGRLAKMSRKAPTLARDIIEGRILGDSVDVTLDSLGKKHGLSRERVRQVEDKIRVLLERVLVEFKDAA